MKTTDESKLCVLDGNTEADFQSQSNGQMEKWWYQSSPGCWFPYCWSNSKKELILRSGVQNEARQDPGEGPAWANSWKQAERLTEKWINMIEVHCERWAVTLIMSLKQACRLAEDRVRWKKLVFGPPKRSAKLQNLKLHLSLYLVTFTTFFASSHLTDIPAPASACYCTMTEKLATQTLRLQHSSYFLFPSHWSWNCVNNFVS